MLPASGLLVAWLFAACSQHVLLNSKDLHKNQTVKIETSDGEHVAGTVMLANAEAVLLRDETGKERGFLTKNIVTAAGPSPILDDNGVLVSEAEIDSFQTHANVTTYAIVGGLISGGVSYLLSNLITRDALGSNNDAPIFIGVSAGTAAGTVLFANSGANKDRENAVNQVLDSRLQADYRISLPETDNDLLIKQKIEEIIEQRKKLEAEIDSLLNDMNTIKEPELK